MRNISPAALAQITANLGGEPLVVVAIYWDGINPTFYCDRGALQAVPELQGKILDMGTLEDVVNISGSTSSQSVNLKLDDTDGSIKAIFNTVDIHKKPVIFYQWFSQLNFSDKFVIFEAAINSPIVWFEKDRTISFDVVSKLEDTEIGYSPEEGSFPELSDELIGKAWPMPFGTVTKIPALRLDILPNALTMDSFGLHDPALVYQILNLTNKEVWANDNAVALIAAGGELEFEGSSLFADPPSVSGPDSDPDLVAQGKQLVAAGNKLLAQAFKLGQDAAKLSEQLAIQRAYEKTSIRLFNGVTYPEGLTATWEIGNVVVTGTINHVAGAGQPGGPVGYDSVLNIQTIKRKEPLVVSVSGGEVATYGVFSPLSGTKVTLNPVQTTVLKGGGNEFIKAGSTLKLLSGLPLRFIAAMLPCTVTGVYAYYDYGSTKIMTAVPTDYYEVSYLNISTIDEPYVTATIITLPNPLSYYNSIDPYLNTGPNANNSATNIIGGSTIGGQTAITQANQAATFSTLTNNGPPAGGAGWSDEIFVDLISPVGPNTANILAFLIDTYATIAENFTNFTWDPITFSMVGAQINPFPMNFCLFDRKNLVQALNEIAFQARCAIFLKENVFYLLYLVPQATPVDTITVDDIVYQTLELHHTPTEQLVTKFVASYKIYYGAPTGSEISDIGSVFDKIILRNNLAKYGLHQQEYNYYAYTNPGLVDLSATFWIIRKSNTWKLVNFKTPLHKLRLETFDSVTIDIPAIANIPVVGVIQSAVLDTSAMDITFSVWVPVRLGEMTVYPFANPVDNEFDFFPMITDQAGSGGPGELTAGNLSSNYPSNGLTISFPKGNRKNINNGNPNPGTTDVGITFPVLPNAPGPLDKTQKPDDLTIDTSYDLSINVPNTLVNKTYPGMITGSFGDSSPGKYNLNLYTQGIADLSVFSFGTATDPSFDAQKNATPVPDGTWVMVSQLIWFTDDNKLKHARYFIPTLPGSSTFPGVVTGGSGDTYTMTIYKTGLTGPTTSVSVKQLQINNDSIPNGTWALVSLNNTPDGPQYTMQVPVWVG